MCVHACVRADILHTGVSILGGGPIVDDKSVYVNIVCFDVGCSFLVRNVHTQGSFEKGHSKTPL